MYVGTPLYNMFKLDDSRNIDKKVEKKYIEARQMFFVPLYCYVFLALASHIFALMLFSTNLRYEHWLFQHDVDSYLQYFVFALVVTFYGALSQIAGHELVHDKAWFNKVIGSIPYT